MRQISASLCVCWMAYCAGAPGSNTLPLTFGMTPQAAEQALGAPLIHHSGRRTSKIYVAARSAHIPGFYPADEAVAMQFRRGRLTGWRYDWRLRRPQWPY